LASGQLKDAEAFCNSTKVNETIRLACYHGIGHGITELVTLDVAKGLKECDKLSDDHGKYQCGHAVLMDFEPPKQGDKIIVPKNMPAYCSKINPIYRAICYEFSGSLTYIRDRNAPAAMRLCKSVPGNIKERCITRVMEVVMNTLPREERTAKIKATCESGDAEYQRWCFVGAAKMAAFTIGGSIGEESIG